MNIGGYEIPDSILEKLTRPTGSPVVLNRPGMPGTVPLQNMFQPPPENSLGWIMKGMAGGAPGPSDFPAPQGFVGPPEAPFVTPPSGFVGPKPNYVNPGPGFVGPMQATTDQQIEQLLQRIMANKTLGMVGKVGGVLGDIGTAAMPGMLAAQGQITPAQALMTYGGAGLLATGSAGLGAIPGMNMGVGLGVGSALSGKLLGTASGDPSQFTGNAQGKPAFQLPSAMGAISQYDPTKYETTESFMAAHPFPSSAQRKKFATVNGQGASADESVNVPAAQLTPIQYMNGATNESVNGQGASADQSVNVPAAQLTPQPRMDGLTVSPSGEGTAPQGTPTMSPIAQQQAQTQAAAQVQHEDLMNKLMSINADIESKDFGPAVKTQIRGAMAKRLMDHGFQDPMLLGMWIQHGSDAFEKLRNIQEQNKKQSGGLTFAERAQLQAGTQAGTAKENEAKRQAMLFAALQKEMANPKADISRLISEGVVNPDDVLNNAWYNNSTLLQHLGVASPKVDLTKTAARGAKAVADLPSVEDAMLRTRKLYEQIQKSSGIDVNSQNADINQALSGM